MKKLFFILLLSISFVFLFSGTANAADLCNEEGGLVPCGKATVKVYRCHGFAANANDPNGDLLEVVWDSIDYTNSGNANEVCRNSQGNWTSRYGEAEPKGEAPRCRCELAHLFIMMLRVYGFIVWYIAIPLAALLVVIGGLLFILAGANQNLVSTAKSMLWGAAIGLILILGSVLIIDIILKAIGYNPPEVWNTFNF